MSLYEQDGMRYVAKKDMPAFQKYFRKLQDNPKSLLRYYYRLRFSMEKRKLHIDLSYMTTVGGGLFFGHPVGITVSHYAKIGNNVNLHKGVTIGQENRGNRKGVPTIGNSVWIGINATVVGNITVGDDVLIAPNTFVNCDVPSHSIVMGNPCIIKHCDNATASYIERKVE